MIRIRPKGLAFAILVAAAGAALAPAASAQPYEDVRVALAPPPLPAYDQPELPGPDYVWAPGYWAWDADFGDYYWVPGAWVLAPEPGYLWTPAWWGWDDGLYAFHPGYWGPHVGFYGGVAYGYGYTGYGYQGGYWTGGHFVYNRAVNRIGAGAAVAVYQAPAVSVNLSSRVSFNGGPGGVQTVPSREELAASQERHFSPTPAQMRQVSVAHATPQLFASANHGAPPIAATPVAGGFSGAGVVRARGASGGAPPPGGGRAGAYDPGAPAAAVRGASPRDRGPAPYPVFGGAYGAPAPQVRGGSPPPRFPAPPPASYAAAPGYGVQRAQSPRETPRAGPAAPRPAARPPEPRRGGEEHGRPQ